LGADALAAKVCVSEMQIEQLTKELTGERVARVKAEDDCKAAVAAAHEVAAKKFDEMLLIEGGLSRTTLLSSKWHKKHPTAVNHLFGFKNWTELKLYVWALFLLKPPKKESRKSGNEGVARKVQRRMSISDMSDFERCLLTKMRIHRG
jgi:hypothetical protein